QRSRSSGGETTEKRGRGRGNDAESADRIPVWSCPGRGAASFPRPLPRFSVVPTSSATPLVRTPLRRHLLQQPPAVQHLLHEIQPCVVVMVARLEADAGVRVDQVEQPARQGNLRA